MQIIDREKLINRVKAMTGVDLVLFLDFETYYKTKNNGAKNPSFQLKGKTYAQYIFDERFHYTGLGFAFDLNDWKYIDTDAEFDDFFGALKEMKASKKIALVCHNTQFDGSILAWKEGITFDFYFCTQLMSTLISPMTSSSLAATAELVFPNDESMRKGKELVSVDGKKREDFTEDDRIAIGEYCIQDNHLMREIFFEFMEEGFPPYELESMHITLRGCIEPQFAINRELLNEVIEEEDQKKSDAIIKAIKFCHEGNIVEVAPGTFSSNDKYQALLARCGVIVPVKTSPTTGKLTPALGQNDPEYIQVQEAYPQLAPLFEARKVAKSSIAKTRAAKMIEVADTFMDDAAPALCCDDADMPFFLKYYGALNTGRWSGGEKLNQQNLQRKSKHRLAMMAPLNHLIVVRDLSNIELRMNLWFCGQDDLLDRIKNEPGFDAYASLATEVFGEKVLKIKEKDEPNFTPEEVKIHGDRRQIGKAGELGLGYAMSWRGFQNYLAGGPLGMDPLRVSDSFARSVKNAYQITHPKIVDMWNEIQFQVLPVLADGGTYRFGRNECVIATKDKLILPSGRELHYPNTKMGILETRYGTRNQFYCDDKTTNRFGVPNKRSLHKGLIIENIIQAISRDVINYHLVHTERSLQQQQWGWVAGSVHDEILAIVRDDFAQVAYDTMGEIMAVPPAWAEGVPLASEGGFAKEYSK